MLLPNPDRLQEEPLRGMHSQKRLKQCSQVVFCFPLTNRFCEPSQSNIEKLLDYLIANHPAFRLYCASDQFFCSTGFGGSCCVEQIHEDVRVQKELTAVHSSLPW